MRVSVIIPTHNEAQAIGRVLGELPSDPDRGYWPYLSIGQYHGSIDLCPRFWPNCTCFKKSTFERGTFHDRFEPCYKDWPSQHRDAAPSGDLPGAEPSANRGRTCQSLWPGLVWAN